MRKALIGAITGMSISAPASSETCPPVLILLPLIQTAMEVRNAHLFTSQYDTYDRCRALGDFGVESMRLVLEGIRLRCPIALMQFHPLIRLKEDGADRRALEGVLAGAYASDLQTGDAERLATAYGDQVQAICLLQGRR